jgi:hypothetical protein
MFRTGLASDETMIAYFKEHRSEIEELVKRFREFEVAPNNETFDNAHEKWEQQSDTPELLQKTNFSYIAAIMGDAQYSDYNTLWFPNPYSVETAQKIKAIKDTSSFEEMRTIFYKYGMVGVHLTNSKYNKYSTKYGIKSKHFIYIPEVPRIEDGKLLSPFDINGEHYFRKQLLSSLNRFPFMFFRYRALDNASNCAWKQIEPQWFLRLCLRG